MTGTLYFFSLIGLFHGTLHLKYTHMLSVIVYQSPFINTDPTPLSLDSPFIHSEETARRGLVKIPYTLGTFVSQSKLINVTKVSCEG